MTAYFNLSLLFSVLTFYKIMAGIHLMRIVNKNYPTIRKLINRNDLENNKVYQ